MNEPIISPWIFYWIDLADSLKLIIFFILLFSFVGFLLAGGNYAFKDERYVRDGEIQRLVRATKFFAYCLLVFVIPFVAIPSQETMYKMLITSQLTPNNIEYLKNEVKATGQGLVDSITDASIKIIKAKESK